jgi:Lon protease-like protein
VRRCLAMAWELGETAGAPSTFELPEDPDQALWGLCARAPVGPMDRQSLLECPGAQERLELLSFLVGQVADVLAQRLAEG